MAGLQSSPPNLGVSRTVLLASPITERKSAGRKQRTYRPTSLKGEFQTPNCQFIHTLYRAPLQLLDRFYQRRIASMLE